MSGSEKTSLGRPLPAGSVGYELLLAVLFAALLLTTLLPWLTQFERTNARAVSAGVESGAGLLAADLLFRAAAGTPPAGVTLNPLNHEQADNLRFESGTPFERVTVDFALHGSELLYTEQVTELATGQTSTSTRTVATGVSTLLFSLETGTVRVEIAGRGPKGDWQWEKLFALRDP